MFYEGKCFICKVSGEIICAKCKNSFNYSPLIRNIYGHDWVSLYQIDQELEIILLEIKNKNRNKLRFFLADCILDSVDNISTLKKLITNSVLIPTPSNFKNQLVRGLDHNWEMLKILKFQANKRNLNLQIYPGLLKSRSGVSDQRGLSASKRMHNMQNTITPNNRNIDRIFSSNIHSNNSTFNQSSHRFLLFDDVVTTGATAMSATRILENRGLAIAGALFTARAGQMRVL